MKVLSQIRRYGLAAISCGLRWRWRGRSTRSSCFFLAVMASSLYGRRGPACSPLGGGQNGAASVSRAKSAERAQTDWKQMAAPCRTHITGIGRRLERLSR